MIYVFANQKGGVAKTTTAHTTGTGLHRAGFRVLLVDCDPQGNLSDLCGAGDADITLYDVLKGNADTAEAVRPVPGYPDGLDIIPGGLMLAAADMEFTTPGREYLLREALSTVRGEYDFIVIDTPPALGILTVNALTAADILAIPSAPDRFSLKGLKQLSGTIATIKKYCNPSLQIAGVLLTRTEENTNADKVMYESIQTGAEYMGTAVFKTRIRKGVAIREAQIIESDIFREAAGAGVTADYIAFIKELTGVTVNE